MRRKAAVAVLWSLCVAASWASYAAPSQGIIGSPVLDAVIVAVITATVTWMYSRRKQGAEVANLDANTIATSAETISDLIDLVQKLQQQVRDAEAHAEKLELEVRALRQEVERLTAALRPGRKTDTETEPTIVPPTPRIQIGKRRR